MALIAVPVRLELVDPGVPAQSGWSWGICGTPVYALPLLVARAEFRAALTSFGGARPHA
jgi:hypothetical protein